MSVPRVRQQLQQQLLRLFVMVGAGRLQQRDGSRQRRAITGADSVLSVMTTPDKAYRWWYRDPLTKILFKGTFAKIGVPNLRWTSYASVTGKTPEQRARMLQQTEKAFAAL